MPKVVIRIGVSGVPSRGGWRRGGHSGSETLSTAGERIVASSANDLARTLSSALRATMEFFS